MKKTKMVEVTETFCDVCGDKCYNHTIFTDASGVEQHACSELNAEQGRMCREILEDEINLRARNSAVGILKGG